MTRDTCSNNTEEPPRYVFVLVHGTFATGAGWTMPTSNLSRSLTSAFQGRGVVVRFDWSGGNAHKARFKAARQLHDFLQTQIERFPDSAIYVFSHSHGGNVAMYALRDMTRREKIFGLVNFATPYIAPRARNLKLYSRLMLVLAPAFLFLLLLMATSLCLHGVVALGNFDKKDVDAFTDRWAAVLLFGPALPAAWLFVKLRRYVLGNLLGRIRRIQEGEISKYTAAAPADLPILSLRVSGDEAAGWLALISWCANAPYLLWHPIVAIVCATGLAALAAIAMASFSMGPAFFEAQNQQTLAEAIGTGSAFGAVVLVISCGIAVVASFVWQPIAAAWSRLFRASVVGFGGGGGVTLNWLIEMQSTVSLADRPNIEQRKYKRPFVFSLRHSLLYDDSECIRDTIDWLVRSDRRRRSN